MNASTLPPCGHCGGALAMLRDDGMSTTAAAMREILALLWERATAVPAPFPSYESIGNRVGSTRHTVLRIVRDLERGGLLTVSVRRGDGARRNVYAFTRAGAAVVTGPHFGVRAEVGRA